MPALRPRTVTRDLNMAGTARDITLVAHPGK
jgi:hypothetical protein